MILFGFEGPQLNTADFVAVVSVSSAVAIGALKIIDYLVRKTSPMQQQGNCNGQDLERILVDHQRENRQTFKEMRDGIQRLVILAEERRD